MTLRVVDYVGRDIGAGVILVLRKSRAIGIRRIAADGQGGALTFQSAVPPPAGWSREIVKWLTP